MNDQGIIKKGEGKYYNPDPLYRLIGRTNEAKLIINGHETTGLIDSGANISAISKSFAEELGLPFRQLKSLLEIEGSGGIDVSRVLAGKLGLLEVFVHWASIISKNNQLDDFRMSFNEPISYTK